MNPFLIQLLAILLGVSIVVVELARGRVTGHLDFFRMASLVYFVCFVILPLYLLHADLSSLRMNWFWLFHRPFNGDSFTLAVVAALAGYYALVLGYLGGRSVTQGLGGLRIALEPPLSPLSISVLAHAVGLLGLLSLIVYTISIGGLAPLILQALDFRSKNPPVISRFSSLKMISPFVMSAAFLFYALAQAQWSRWGRRQARIGFWIYFIASLVVLFHQAGRYPLAAFLLTFPIARMVRTNRLQVRSAVVTVALLAGIFLFGKVLFEAKFGTGVLASQSENLKPESIVRFVLVEFAFPVVTLSNTIVEVPSEVPFRFFYDFPLAVEYLIPQTLTGLTHPPTVSMLNSFRLGYSNFSTVPVDIVSLGYYSAGAIGVVLLMAAFGLVLSLFERILPASADPLSAVLRTAWMFFMAMRVLYGDPQLVWGGGLHLIGVTLLVLWLRAWLARPMAPAMVPA